MSWFTSTSTTDNQFSGLPTFKDFVPKSPSPPHENGNSTDLKIKTEDLDELLQSNEKEKEEAKAPLFKSKTGGPEGLKERVEELKVNTEGLRQRFITENGKTPEVREKEAFALAKLMALVEQSIDEVEELLQLVPTYDSEEEQEKTREQAEQAEQRKRDVLKESEQEIQLARQLAKFNKGPTVTPTLGAQLNKQSRPRTRKKNNPKSEYHGCFWCPSLGKWAGGYVVGGKHKMIKKGHDEHEVARFVRAEVRRLNKKGIAINMKYGDLKGKKYGKINKRSQREAAEKLAEYRKVKKRKLEK